MTDAEPTLYLIYLRDPQRTLEVSEFEGLRQLDDGLFLLRSSESRSRVYHAMKRASAPAGLLVAPLAGAPKFKGMADGAMRWLRNTGYEDG